MPDRLFVYGTLRNDVPGSAARLLGPDARLLGFARARGRLFSIGRYPGFVPASEPDAWVHGQLFVLANPSEAFTRLDVHEGCSPEDPHPHEFERVQLQVIADSGDCQHVWTYVYKGSTQNKRIIASGDYSAR
jgi:gamma-glutamylcyclotransferase (GGCT)/AIG2-like uncharacterized protein YtfP